MKHSTCYFLIFSIMIGISEINSVRLAKDIVTSKDEVSDKEIDELLKDPKYSSLLTDAGLSSDVAKDSTSLPTTPAMPLSTTPAMPLSTTPATPQATDTSPPKQKRGHYMSPAYKEHLARMKKKGKTEDILKNSKRDDAFVNMNQLSQKLGSDPLKDLDLLSTSTPLKLEKDDKKTAKDDLFSNIDFISKQQARYLIEVLKQPVFFNNLPSEAQAIVKAIQDNFSFILAENSKLNDFIETSLMNPPNSVTYIDSDGMISRKGILLLIDPTTGDSKFVWAIANSKVFCFYQSQSLLTIEKLYRNSSLAIKDTSSSPCFITYSLQEIKDGSILACAASIQEKEVWMETIKSHLVRIK